MLTKSDLKAIEDIVDSKLDSKLDLKLKPIYKRLDKIDKKLDKTIDFFDVRELQIVKEVKIIQKHVGLPIMEFA